ncbi:hypothetical protein [Pedobacter steynii]
MPSAFAESFTYENSKVKPDPFKLGIAGYTFINFNLDESLAMMKKVDVHYLCIKDFHLPYKSSAEEIAAFHAKLKENGITGYAVGPIYTKTRKEIDDAFDYAKRVGVDLVIGIPCMPTLIMLPKRQKNITFDMPSIIMALKINYTLMQKVSITSLKILMSE